MQQQLAPMLWERVIFAPPERSRLITPEKANQMPVTSAEGIFSIIPTDT